ncbi:MAG: type II toxin-antitoxin system RelE/ParE family toxin [Opitutales bacterium]
MSSDLILLPEAALDLEDAYRWYRMNASTETAKAFLKRLDEALESITASPTSFRIRFQGLRFAPLKQFPYFIVFRIDTDSLRVFAVFHARRNSATLQKRL